MVAPAQPSQPRLPGDSIALVAMVALDPPPTRRHVVPECGAGFFCAGAFLAQKRPVAAKSAGKKRSAVDATHWERACWSKKSRETKNKSQSGEHDVCQSNGGSDTVHVWVVEAPCLCAAASATNAVVDLSTKTKIPVGQCRGAVSKFLRLPYRVLDTISPCSSLSVSLGFPRFLSVSLSVAGG